MRLDAVAKRYNHKGVSPMDFSTRAIHAGQPADPSTGATITPIFQTSTYTQQGLGENKGYEYSRTGNPTRAALETCLASLENATHGLAFGSGMAATSAVLSILRPGDHVIAGDDLYGGTYRIFERVLRPMGVDFSYVRSARCGRLRAGRHAEDPHDLGRDADQSAALAGGHRGAGQAGARARRDAGGG